MIPGQLDTAGEYFIESLRDVQVDVSFPIERVVEQVHVRPQHDDDTICICNKQNQTEKKHRDRLLLVLSTAIKPSPTQK